MPKLPLTPCCTQGWLNIAQQTVRQLGIPNQLAGRVYAGTALSAYTALTSLPTRTSINADAVVAYAAHSFLTNW